MNRRIFHTRTYSSPSSYSAEAIALFAAMAIQLTDPQKAVVDYVITTLKTSGSWDELDVLWFPMLVTEQQSCLNWKNPATFTLVPTNFSTSFVTKVGFPAVLANSTYLDTGYTPSTNGVKFTATNASVFAYVKDNKQDDGYTLGGIGGGDILIRQRDSGNNFIGRINESQNSIASITDSSGLWSVATDGTNCIQKRNGSTLATTASATTTLNTTKQFVYCWNDGGNVPTNFLDNNTIQAIGYGSNLVDYNVITTVTNYLKTNL